MTITIRIGRLVTDQSPGDAAATATALRHELARLIAERGVPAGPSSGAQRDGGVVRAATPAGRGREAAARVLGSLT